MQMFRTLFIVCVFSIALFSAGFANAASISVQVSDGAGAPLENTVVYAELANGQIKQKSLKPAEISQVKRQFVPLVTVVQVGTEISFPNLDSVKHHVYSFSPTKVFDLPLYSGKAAAPQLFDKVGTVVLGCNIHDKMIAYVQVVDTPFFAKTDALGKARLDGLPPGSYVLKAWHYGLPPLQQVVSQPVNLAEGENNATFKLNVVKKPVEQSNSMLNPY